MNTPRRRAGISLLLLLSGCTGAAESHREPQVPDVPVTAALQPMSLALGTSPTDTVSTLAAINAFMQRVDQDTVRMVVSQREADLGAGATALVTSWRAGGVLQRLRVASAGAGFQTFDLYWFSDTTLVAATLESVRPARRPERERLWFRTGRLYRWIDAEGRTLNPDARSTQYELDAFHARLQRMLATLSTKTN